MVFAVPPWFIDASRRQPQRVSWEKRAVSSYNTPASNGANRHSLLTDKAFNLQLRGHIQRRCGAGISSAPTLCSRPWRLLVLITVILFKHGLWLLAAKVRSIRRQ